MATNRRWKWARAAALAVTLGAAGAGAATIDGAESYGLLFRQGTLDAIDRNLALTYQRDVVSPLNPDAEKRNAGHIFLKLQEDSPLALLEFRQEGKHQGLGQFPASVGNPMIMFFYESVVRDMAATAGGSPFYIRNRVKDALTQPGEMTKGQAIYDGKTIETTTIDLYPFADDPNRDRMRGFEDLVLSVTMSEDVDGWYLSLIAEAKPEPAPAEPKPEKEHKICSCATLHSSVHHQCQCDPFEMIQF